MSAKKMHNTARCVLIGLAAITLSACQSSEGEYFSEVAARWQQIPPVPENQVETIALEHPVAFGTNAKQASDAERRRMRDFIISSDVTSFDTVIIEGPASSSGQYDSLSSARIDSLIQEFADLGLPVYVADAATSSSRAKDQVNILVTRAIAVPPDCAGSYQVGQWPEYELGCSNSAALGQMIADPRDLNRGRDLAPADGERASVALQRYRSGETEELLEEGTDQ